MSYKIGMLIFDFLGIPTTILGIAYNWGDIKGISLLILSLVFICVRFAFYVDDKLEQRRSKRIERKMKELDLQEKKHKHRNKNNENY